MSHDVYVQIMYFLVKSSPPKPLGVTASNFARAYVIRFIEGTGQRFAGTQGQGQRIHFLVNASLGQ